MDTNIEGMQKIKVYAYLRKSTEENKEGESRRQLNSLAYQKMSVEETAKRNNLEIVKFFRDQKTAYKAFVRNEFNRMMDSFDENGVGGEVKGIVCSEHSRLARNFADGGLVLWYLQSGLIERVYTHDKIFTNSADDQMMLAISFAMDKHASDETGFRMRKAWEFKASEGQPPNHHLVGYKYVGDKGKKVWKIDPQYGSLIKELFLEYSTGKYTLQEITDYMGTRGLVNRRTKKPYSKNSILEILKKVEYTGVFYYKEKKCVGSYIPLIDSELFYKVQEVLNDKSHTKYSLGNEYAYSGGLIRCSVCGENMSGTIRKGITYYRCLNRKEPCRTHKEQRPSYLREDYIDEKMSEILLKIEISEQEFEKIAEYVNLLFEDDKARYINELRKLSIQRKDAESELAEYTKDLLQHKKINKQNRDELWISEEKGYLVLMKDASERIKMLDDTIEKQNEIKEKLPSMMFNFLDAIKTAGKRFQTASPENKRMIVKTLCANFKWDGKNLVWEWKKPYDILANKGKRVSWLRE